MIIAMDMSFIMILGLAAFRLTRLIVFDKIMEFIRSPFFDEIVEDNEVYLIPKALGIRHWIGQLLSCYWCVGIWVSAFLVSLYVLIPIIGEPIIVILAVAGIGAILETVIGKLIA